MRPSGRHDKEEIFVLQARPACWQGRHITATVAVEKQGVIPVHTPLNKIERLPEQRMKGMSDSNRCGQISGATCSWSIGRKLFSSTQTTSSSGAGISVSCLHLRRRSQSTELLDVRGLFDGSMGDSDRVDRRSACCVATSRGKIDPIWEIGGVPLVDLILFDSVFT